MGNEEMETGVQNLAGKTGGLVILSVRVWSTGPSVQLTDKARMGVSKVWLRAPAVRGL